MSISVLDNRILIENDTALGDYSFSMNNYISGTKLFDFVATEDYLYIGRDLPWNHFWFEMSVVNDQASSVSIDLWKNRKDGWVSAVNILDDTDLSGAALGKSGILTFELDKDQGWGRDDTDEMTNSGLESLKIYDKYWARLSWSADFNALTEIKYIGQKFSSDEELGIQYPDLNTTRAKTAFTSGKTNWDDQHFLAAECVFRELDKKREEIISRHQFIRWDQWREAAIHKVAALIFNAFGDDYKEQRELAEKKFFAALDLKRFLVDLNANTRLDDLERVTEKRLVRR